jgi:hypothetical protein
MLTLMLLVVCIGANAEKKYLTFKCEDYCAAKWNAETNTFSWGSGGWNTAWTFMAANGEDGKAVSGDLSEWELLHLNAKNFTNASAQELTVVFKKNDGSNPPSGPTKEFVVTPDENGDITIDLTNVEWGNCDITNIQDLTIYGGARVDATIDASCVVTDAYLAKGESEAPVGTPFFDFQNNNGGWTIGEGSDFAKGELTEENPITMGGVTLTGIQGEATNAVRYFNNSSKGNCLWIFKNNSIKLTAPEGMSIVKAEFTMQTGSFDLTPSTGEVVDDVWTGEAAEVTFGPNAKGTR